jgi:hypothetical protein
LLVIVLREGNREHSQPFSDNSTSSLQFFGERRALQNSLANVTFHFFVMHDLSQSFSDDRALLWTCITWCSGHASPGALDFT